MKVSEAKELICPFMSNGVNGTDFGTSYTLMQNCICGDCMAWKWKKEPYAKNSLSIGYRDSDTDGYCQRLSDGQD